MKIWCLMLLFLRYAHSTGKHCSATKEPLKMKILYAALCEDSQKLITDFWPVFKEFHQCLNVTLVPYGNTKKVKNGFKCQHGQEECSENKLHNCAFHTHLSPMQKMKFAYCEMKSLIDIEKHKKFKCAQSFHIETHIKKCLKSHGEEYQNGAAKITAKYKFKSIPAVIINGVYNASIQKAIESNVHRSVCSILTTTHHLSPKDCLLQI